MPKSPKAADGLTENDKRFLELAYQQALKSYNEGGLPIGAVLVRDGKVIGQGHNQRVQQGNPIAHGEMDCIQHAGRQRSYKTTTLYTSLSPCMMCAGTVVQFKIPRIVIGENKNFGGNEQFLIEHGVKVVIANHKKSKDLMARFIVERPDLWHEDIAVD